MASFERTKQASGFTATEPKSLLGSAHGEAAFIDPTHAHNMLTEAKAVLVELEAGRRVIESKLEEERRGDAMKGVRGASSLDEAIRSTEELIAVPSLMMDRLILRPLTR